MFHSLLWDQYGNLGLRWIAAALDSIPYYTTLLGDNTIFANGSHGILRTLPMESAAAAQHLQPRTFVIALTASTPTIGTLGPRAFPLIYALVCDEVGIPHAITSRVTKTFADVLNVAHRIPFSPDSHLMNQFGLCVPLAVASGCTLDHVLSVLLEHFLFSVDGLRTAAELLDPQVDPTFRGEYEPNGVISCFLRKVSVAFASLTFEAVARLLHDLRLFVNPKLGTNISSYSSREIMPKPVLTRCAAMDMATGVAVQSVEDFQEWTKLHARSREPVVATNMGIQALNYLGRERGVNTEHPSIEYVMQLEAQRRKDFGTAVDALHRYFDLSIAEIGRASMGKEDDTDGKDRKKTETYGHQYAALSLGVLHAQFGNPEYAAVALDDTIRASQHCGDEACQARALSWIARTCSSVAKRHQMLRHANEQLALAREELCTVFTPVSDEIPYSANMSSALDAGKSSEKRGGESLHGLNPATRLSRIQTRIDYIKSESRVDSLLMSAAAWESHASSPTALSVARMALSFAMRIDEDRLSNCKARALAAVASLTALEGDHNSAIALLEEVLASREATHNHIFANKNSTNAPEIKVLCRCLAWLKFELSLRRGDTAAAQGLSKVLSAFAEGATQNALSSVAEDIVLDSLEVKAKLHLTLSASQQATEYAGQLCRRAASFARPARVVEGLRLRAEAHLAANSHEAALPAALAAVSLSQGLGLEFAHVSSVLTLTETMLRMDEKEAIQDDRALRALSPIIARAMDGVGAGLRARALRLHAECLILFASWAGEPPTVQVVEMIQLAERIYEQVEDAFGTRDCAYLLARVLHWRREVSGRNAAAKKFLETERILLKREGSWNLNNKVKSKGMVD